jgi:hypothetical protein
MGMPSLVDEFRDDPALVAAHLEAVAARTWADGDRLVEGLCARCWPGGVGDRLDPVAAEWVRRWSPNTLTAARIRCSCADGRCDACN